MSLLRKVKQMLFGKRQELERRRDYSKDRFKLGSRKIIAVVRPGKQG